MLAQPHTTRDTNETVGPHRRKTNFVTTAYTYAQIITIMIVGVYSFIYSTSELK